MSRFSVFSTNDLEREIMRRKARLNELLESRQILFERVKAVNEEIKNLGGESTTAFSKPRRNRGRPRGASKGTTLREAISSVLSRSSEPMSPKDISEKLMNNGYKTESSNFRLLVTQTLTRHNEFKRVDRGQYTVEANTATASE